MAYEKLGFTPNQILKADQLNHMEQGIADAHILKPATKETIGMVKIGKGLTVDSNGKVDLIGDLNFNNLSNIQKIVQAGQGPEFFPIGDQLIIPWKDMDDANHNTDETAYQVEWNIVHHGDVELEDGRVVPGMFIQMNKCSAYGVQFSSRQAFYQAYSELPPATYHVNFGVKYNDTFTAGTSGQFTLTKSVPEGGRLFLSGEKVQLWNSAEVEKFTEAVPLTIGNSGTELGTISSYDKKSDSGLNAMQRVTYGHNRWATSAIRQYLNAKETNWFRSMEEFDIRPVEYNKHGFMAGFNNDFLNVLKPVKVTTALNTAEGFINSTDNTFDTFFLPSLQQMNIEPQLVDAEGDYFEYWRMRLNATDYVNTNTAFDAFKIPSINKAYPQHIRLRSVKRASSGISWYINASGKILTNAVFSALYFTPVCVIC